MSTAHTIPKTRTSYNVHMIKCQHQPTTRSIEFNFEERIVGVTRPKGPVLVGVSPYQSISTLARGMSPKQRGSLSSSLTPRIPEKCVRRQRVGHISVGRSRVARSRCINCHRAACTVAIDYHSFASNEYNSTIPCCHDVGRETP
jgi:hypothetical protein